MYRHFHLLPPFIRRFGMIPESYKIAMTYEEQLLWLCKYVEDLGLEIENIKIALQNIENAVNELDTRLTGLSERVDTNAIDIAYLKDKFLNGYLITILTGDTSLDSFRALVGNSSYIYSGDYIVTDRDDTVVIDNNTLFFYDSESKAFKIYENRDEVIHRFIYYDSEVDEWKDYTYNIVDFVNQYSSQTQVPNAKAVYDAIAGSQSVVNYNYINNLPTINGVTVEGNLTSSDLHIDSATPSIDYSSQFVTGYQVNLFNSSAQEIGEVLNITPQVEANGGYFIKPVKAGEEFVMSWTNMAYIRCYVTDSDYEILEVHKNFGTNDSLNFITSHNGILICSTSSLSEVGFTEIANDYYYQNIEDNAPIKTINYDIILNESSSQISGYDSGYYFLKGSYVKVFDGTDYNEIPDTRNSIIYLSTASDTITIINKDNLNLGTQEVIAYDTNQWVVNKGELVTVIDSNPLDSEIPSALAVKTYVDTTLGGVATTLNNINVGSGVV